MDGTAGGLDAAAGELYGRPPGDFVATRDRLAAEARRGGDRELGVAIKALRRPSAGAWLANLLVRRRASQVGQLVDLGAALRAAQDRLAADDLRRLARQRRQVVSSLVREATALAAEAGASPSGAAVRELEATLDAAMADPAAADVLRCGRLTAGLHPSDAVFSAGGAAPPLPPVSAAAALPVATAGEGAAAEEAARAARMASARSELAGVRADAAAARRRADAAAAGVAALEVSEREAAAAVSAQREALAAAEAAEAAVRRRLVEGRDHWQEADALAGLLAGREAELAGGIAAMEAASAGGVAVTESTAP